MRINPDPKKLISARVSRPALHSAFGTALLTAASLDCRQVVDPRILQAQFGETLAANLAIARLANPEMQDMYAIVLSDYLRFCRLYIREAAVGEDGFAGQVYRSLVFAIRRAYLQQKRELLEDPGG